MAGDTGGFAAACRLWHHAKFGGGRACRRQWLHPTACRHLATCRYPTAVPHADSRRKLCGDTRRYALLDCIPQGRGFSRSGAMECDRRAVHDLAGTATDPDAGTRCGDGAWEPCGNIRCRPGIQARCSTVTRRYWHEPAGHAAGGEVGGSCCGCHCTCRGSGGRHAGTGDGERTASGRAGRRLT